MTPLKDAMSREEKERRRDEAAQAAEGLVYGVGRFDPTYAGDMSAAAAYATLAAYYQARIEWEHGVGY